MSKISASSCIDNKISVIIHMKVAMVATSSRNAMRITVISDGQIFLDSNNYSKNVEIQHVGYSNAFVRIANNPVDVVILDKNSHDYSNEKYLATKIHSFFKIAKMPMPKFVILKHGESELSETESMFCDYVAIEEIENYVESLECTQRKK